jgi:hypothetical protein
MSVSRPVFIWLKSVLLSSLIFSVEKYFDLHNELFPSNASHFKLFYISQVRSSALFQIRINFWTHESISTFWYDSLYGRSAHRKALYLHRIAQDRKTRDPRAGFEPITPVSEPCIAIRSLDHEVTESDLCTAYLTTVCKLTADNLRRRRCWYAVV